MACTDRYPSYALGLLLWCSVATAGPDIPAGTYTIDHEIGFLGSDKTMKVQSSLGIAYPGTDTMRFEVLTNFYNGYSCELNGTAERTAPGVFEYRTALEPETAGASCRLRIERRGDSITLWDEGEQCRTQFCGAGASFSGVQFPLSRRAPPHDQKKH